MTRRRVTTEQLRVGDTIEVWWRPGRDTITALRPYTGPLECLGRAKVAAFALYRPGMTMAAGESFWRVCAELASTVTP